VAGVLSGAFQRLLMDVVQIIVPAFLSAIPLPGQRVPNPDAPP